MGEREDDGLCGRVAMWWVGDQQLLSWKRLERMCSASVRGAWKPDLDLGRERLYLHCRLERLGTV